MKYLVCKDYSYVDLRGVAHAGGTMVEADPGHKNTICQLYKLQEIREYKTSGKPKTIHDMKMVAKIQPLMIKDFEPKVEEPKVEEPKVEEPKVEEPKVEEPKQEPKLPPAIKPEGGEKPKGTIRDRVEALVKQEQEKKND